MFALVKLIFWAEKTLVKSMLISTLDKVIYCIGTFYRAQKTSLYYTK
jgi:hypothetical protein